jgi:excisionase family DNA binding protein
VSVAISHRQVPRVTLTKREAADALGISVDHLERWVLPGIRTIRSGRRVLVSVRELERWATDHEARALGADL